MATELTDVAEKFVKAATGTGIPIAFTEDNEVYTVTLKDGHVLVVLASGLGYENIKQIITRAFQELDLDTGDAVFTNAAELEDTEPFIHFEDNLNEVIRDAQGKTIFCTDAGFINDETMCTFCHHPTPAIFLSDTFDTESIHRLCKLADTVLMDMEHMRRLCYKPPDKELDEFTLIDHNNGDKVLYVPKSI